MGLRRITATVGTVPNYTALSGTTVTSQTDTTVLLSSGTDNLNDVFRDGALGVDSKFWIYVPAATPKIRKVTGLYQISLTAGTYVFSIQLDAAMTGASSSACNSVEAGIAYSIVNDGGADGTIDGVTIHDQEGVTYSPYEKYSNRPKVQPVLYVDGTSTSFLINEET